jgi:hypothetical protein
MFSQIRVAPGGKGLAFAEFQDDVQANMAIKQLNGFQLSATHTLNLSISK